RAAGRAHAAHRRAAGPLRKRSGMVAALRRLQAETAGIGLDRGAQRRLRVSLRRRQTRATACPRRRARSLRRGRAPHQCRAARLATSTIRMVMASVGDALGAGYVASLARPGGNVSGLTLVATDQSAKRLQLVKEIVPNLVRVALLWNANASGHRLQLQEMERATPALGIVLQSFPIRTADDVQGSLQAAVQANAQAIVTMDDPVLQSQRARIVAFAMA